MLPSIGARSCPLVDKNPTDLRRISNEKKNAFARICLTKASSVIYFEITEVHKPS